MTALILTLSYFLCNTLIAFAAKKKIRESVEEDKQDPECNVKEISTKSLVKGAMIMIILFFPIILLVSLISILIQLVKTIK